MLVHRRLRLPSLDLCSATRQKTHMSNIYKIMSDSDWRTFQLSSLYEGSAADKADGYIHFSAFEQLEETLAKHYAGRSGLVLLEVDTEALPPEQLKWEPARGGTLFPHLYGPLPLASVRHALSIALLEDGSFALPSDFFA